MDAKSVALSVVYSRADDFCAGSLGGLLELVGQPLTVGGAVIDDGDALDAQLAGCECAQRAALLHVVGEYAERPLVALARVLRIGGRRRHLNDAGVVIDARRRNGGAAVQVTDHRIDARIGQLLRHRGALTRIGLIVLAQQLELRHRVADPEILGIQILDCQARTVFIVLAQMRLRTGQRCHMAQPHRDRRHGGRVGSRRGGHHFGRLVAAGCQQAG
jgi:hypothetical protein